MRLFLKDSTHFATAHYSGGLWKLATIPPMEERSSVPQHALPPMIYAIDTNPNVKMERWHQRYGHLNYEDVKRAQSMTNGMDLLPADL